MYDFRNYQAKFNPPVTERKHAHTNGVLLAPPCAASSPHPFSPTEEEAQLLGCSLTPPQKHIPPARHPLKYAAPSPNTEGIYHKIVIFYNFIGSYLSWIEKTNKPSVLSD